MAVLLASFAPAARADSKRSAEGVPRLDHITGVVLENQNYDVTRVQPWTASWLTGGTSFSQSSGITHPSNNLPAIRAEIDDASGRRVREIVSGVRRGEVMPGARTGRGSTSCG